MAGTTEHASQTAGHGKHVHHGRTAAAWAGTTIAMIAIIIGGIALIVQVWPLFWIGVALLVASLIVTKILQVMGHGAN